MSSVKGLKKEISNITYEVVSDCFTYLLVNDNKDKEKVHKIISDTVALRNELIHRIGQYDNEKNSKSQKAYYAKIRVDLQKGMDKSLEKLSKLAG